MSAGFIIVPPDSTGKRIVQRSYLVGADTVHSQGVHYDGLPSYRIICESGAPATNKYHLFLGNNGGSGQILHVTGLYALNLQTATVTGVLDRYNFRRVTGTPTLTAVTPAPMNLGDSLTGVTAGHTVTAGLTDSTLLLPIILSSEEHTAVPANTSQHLHNVNLLPPINPYARPLALRAGESVAVRQQTAGAVGGFAWIMDFAVEPA